MVVQLLKHPSTSGTGASAIFPLLGTSSYGWRFVGTEIDPESIQSAMENIQRNQLGELISIRKVDQPNKIFVEVLLPNVCNSLSLSHTHTPHTHVSHK